MNGWQNDARRMGKLKRGDVGAVDEEFGKAEQLQGRTEKGENRIVSEDDKGVKKRLT
jgi:hypothetical protein